MTDPHHVRRRLRWHVSAGDMARPRLGIAFGSAAVPGRRDPSERERLRAQMAALDADLADIARRMDEADTDRQDVETLAGLDRAWQSYDDWRHRNVIAPMEAGDYESAHRAYDAAGYQRAHALDEAIDAFLAKKSDVGVTLAANAEPTYLSTRTVSLALSSGAAAF